MLSVPPDKNDIINILSYSLATSKKKKKYYPCPIYVKNYKTKNQSTEQKCLTIYKSRRSPTCVVPLLCSVRRGEKRQQPQQTFLIDLTTHSQVSPINLFELEDINPFVFCVFFFSCFSHVCFLQRSEFSKISLTHIMPASYG